MSHKLYNPKAHAPSIYMPCWLIQIPTNQLSSDAKLLYGRLAQWSNEKCQVHRPLSKLSEELGVPARTLERHLKELRDKKLLRTFRTVEGGENHYEFLQHEWMEEKINENLVYKNDTYSAPRTHGIPPPQNCGYPPADLRITSIKEIKEIGVCGPTAHQHTHREDFSTPKDQTQTQESAFNDESLKELFAAKFFGLNITYSELFVECKRHYDLKRQWVNRKKWKAWIEREKLDNYSKHTEISKTEIATETEEERKARQFFTYELEKEAEGKGYISEKLQEYPQMREKYAKYIKQG